MPSIGTRGSISARGLGFTGGSVLTVYSFPSGTTTFTVPSGVTSLVSVVGRGQNGTAGGWSSLIYPGSCWASGYPGSDTGSVSITWNYLYNQAVAFRDTVNSSGSGERTISLPYLNFAIYESNPSNYGTLYLGNKPAQLIRGSAVLAYLDSPPSSGTITYSSVGYYVSKGYYLYGLEKYTNPTTGANTTGFNLTFPGGSGGAATTQTYNSVSVTPGQTYTIVNSGSLTISYYVS
jgi:hypothetical protein